MAGLAGLPPKVIRRAREILAELESQQDAPKKTGAREASQVSRPWGEEEVLTTLRNTPVETLTPLQALNLLHELKGKFLNAAPPQGGAGSVSPKMITTQSSFPWVSLGKRFLF